MGPPADSEDSQRHDDFDARLDALGRDAADLAGGLAVALEGLRGEGTPVHGRLVERLTEYRARLDALRSDLEGLAAAEGLGPAETTEFSLAWLRGRAAEVARAGERRRAALDRRERAVAALGRLAGLVAVEPSAEPVAERLRSLVSSLAAELADAPGSEPDGALDRAVPFEALDRLARERHELPMDALSDLADRAASAVGFPVVLAVTSGRITPPAATPAPDRPAEVQVETPPPSAPEELDAAPVEDGSAEAAALLEPVPSPLPEEPPTPPEPPAVEDEPGPAAVLTAEDESTPDEVPPSPVLEADDPIESEPPAVESSAPFDGGWAEEEQALEVGTATEVGEDEPPPAEELSDGNTRLGLFDEGEPAAADGWGQSAEVWHEPSPIPPWTPPTPPVEPEAAPQGVGVRLPRGAAGMRVTDAVLAADETREAAAWDDVLWCLVRDNRPGPAFHLARYLELNGGGGALPSELLEVLALVPGLRSSGSEAVPRVRDALHLLSALASRFRAESASPSPSAATSAASLAVFAAALRPALLVQGTGAPEMLAGLHIGAELLPLAKLRDVALGPSRMGLVLTAAELKGNTEGPQWQAELGRLREEVDGWLNRERTGKVIFKGAADVWHRWLRDDGPVGRMLGRVLRDDWNDAIRVAASEDVRHWSDAPYVDRELHRTDLELRHIGAKRRPIDARSITSIRNRCREAAGLVSAWLHLMERRPTQDSDWINEQVATCRQELTTAAGQALAVLESTDPGPSLATEAALAAARRAVGDLARLLDPHAPEEPPPPPVPQLLSRELLRLPGVDLDDRWEPLDPGADALGLGLLRSLAAHDRPWELVLQDCWERLDFVTAERVLDVVEFQAPGPGGGTGTDARDRHDLILAERRDGLTGMRDRLRTKVEGARLGGLIDEDERLNLTNRLAAVEPARSLRLDREGHELRAIHDEFGGMKRRRIEAFEAQFRALGLPATHPAHARVRRLLDAEDLVTAHEYLTQLETGEGPPDTESTVPGFDFFDPRQGSDPRDMFSRLEPLFFGKDRLSARDVARRLGDRLPLPGIDVAALLTPGQAVQARKVLEEWNELRLPGRDAAAVVQRTLTYLGFRVRSLRELPDPPPGARRFDADAEPFESRNDCLLPDYGSRCRGRYHVVCLERQPLEEEILKLTGPDRRSHPVIVFYLGGMSERRRRDLAHALRRQGARRLLVLDDVLLLYVALQKRRTPAFFHAASQFGTAEPYVTTSSQIPPEMFFGRETEIASVFEADGTNLVYGGRQLGKTALLNEVRRRYHRPDTGTVVELINLLHDEHIGLNRSLDDIWAVIAGRLQPYGVITPATRKPETLSEQIVRWLNDDTARRIVLLLDEADLFLNSDSKEGWPRVGKLKTLMEDTERRFKVVFAGLHNVQRTSHDVNTPLGHLVKATCVGPFLSPKEMRAAGDMVSLPFRALGYRFESPELVARVLAQANYYPSLIQILCQQLLKRLSDPQNTAFDPNRTPPYLIRLSHLEDAFADPDVRRQIYDRFRWTIELDNRYRVIALSLALETSEDSTPATRGFSLAEIRDAALAVWPHGFAESNTNDAFRSLLDEMCELGVLRPRDGGRYAMRSPNVVRLLGTRDDIWQALEDAARVPAKIEYEAQSFRRVYDQYSKWRRSPLTADQESRLLAPNTHGLFTLFGSRAAGLDEVVPFLRNLGIPAEAGKLTVTVLEDIEDAPAYRERLDAVLHDRDDGMSLVAVDDRCPWTEDWVTVAAEALRRRPTAKQRVVKLLFVGGPRAAWLWGEPDRALRARLEAAGLVEMSLSPWTDAAVRRWKKEAEFGEDTDEDSRRFREATGNWCSFLHEAGRRCLQRPYHWKSVVAEYQSQVRAAGEQGALAEFGVVPEALPALRAMAVMGEPVDADQLCDLLEMEGVESSAESAARVLGWADRLALLRAAGEGRWCLDPFLAGLLNADPGDVPG